MKEIPRLSPALVLLMAVTTGLAVASNYYAQPLLHTIARRLSLSYSHAGIIVTTAQSSYAIGLLLLVPLGDMVRHRRRLIVTMMILAATGLLISASAANLATLLAGTAITGLFSVVAQILVPLSASLAEPERRGKIVGTVMGGLLLGILLARTVAGALSSLANWHTVYWIAAALMLLNAAALWRMLPELRQPGELSYRALLFSIVHLFRQHPLYRIRAALGFLIFAIFSVLWTSMAFLLSSPSWHLSDAAIGLFGLAGAAGAIAARRVGTLVDRGHAHRITITCMLMLITAWIILEIGQNMLIPLVIGILMLDLAVQAAHITNLNVIYALDERARNRLNSGYMFLYFLGGACGSQASAWSYEHYAWHGVVAVGIALAATASAVALLSRRA